MELLVPVMAFCIVFGWFILGVHSGFKELNKSYKGIEQRTGEKISKW